MKYVRFKLEGGEVKKGILEGGKIKKIRGEIWESWVMTSEEFHVKDVVLLAPVLPGKIVGVGANYRSFLDEKKREYPKIPRIFLKPSTSVIGNEDRIVCPDPKHFIQYEGELGAVIGKRCSRVKEKDVLDHICGYTCINDLTDRTMLEEDKIWARGKGQDTFAPLGPCISDGIDLKNSLLTTRVNGVEKQRMSLSDMYFSVEELISYISRNMTLLPGDVVATGTPAGAGRLYMGDTVEVEIENIGILKNRMVGRKAP